MTNRLYDLDSYVTRCQSPVLACCQGKKNGLEGWLVELESTCFFPEGGGQPSDTGTLTQREHQVKVLYVFEEEGRVQHLCDGPLETGAEAVGELDFARRFAHMQTHCGEHILSGVIWNEYGLRNVGFHMGHENTIDIAGELTMAQCREIERRVNAIIWEDRPVHVSYPDPETLATLPVRKRPEVERLRVVEIEGCDWCGCCGTHVARTGEIGLLKIVDCMRYKGGSRLTFLFGGAAMEDYADKHQALRELGAQFSCKPLEVPTCVEKLQQELSQAKAALSQISRRLAQQTAQALLTQGKTLPWGEGQVRWAFLADAQTDFDTARELAMALSKEEGVLCTVFCLEENGARYALSVGSGAVGDRLGQLCRQLNSLFAGKGGGRGVCCGSLGQAVTAEQLEEVVRNFCQQ